MSLSPNFSVGTKPKIGYIIHGTLGNYDGAVQWLCTPPEKRPVISYSSAHYVIAKDGRYTQLVDDKDVAWHAGNITNPTERAKGILPKENGKFLNPNESFIGIELEWFKGDVITPQQYEVMAKIINGSGIKNPLLLCHTEVTDYKADFGTESLSIIKNLELKLSPSPTGGYNQKSSELRAKAAFALRDWQVSIGVKDFEGETNPDKIRFGPKSAKAFNIN